MSIEQEVFKRIKLDEKKLLPYGFKKESDIYKYSKTFMDNQFRADIYIDKNGNVYGKVYDIEMNEEYTNIRIEDAVGGFVNKVKEEYIKILKEISQNCFIAEYFTFPQANRIAKLIEEKYNVKPEFLWEKFPEYGVFRNKREGKWFAVIMNIDKGKIIQNQKGEIPIIDIKVNQNTEEYLKKKGIYEAYHLNKKNWITIILDDTLTDEEIINIIENNVEISNSQKEWIVPANMKYYDIINAFNSADNITWKQSSNILKGDIVYIYVGVPYSALMFKCIVKEANIPYKYKDENLSMSRIMKLKLIKKYQKEEFNLEKLKKYGIKSIRSQRKITNELSKELNK